MTSQPFSPRHYRKRGHQEKEKPGSSREWMSDITLTPDVKQAGSIGDRRPPPAGRQREVNASTPRYLKGAKLVSGRRIELTTLNCINLLLATTWGERSMFRCLLWAIAAAARPKALPGHRQAGIDALWVARANLEVHGGQHPQCSGRYYLAGCLSHVSFCWTRRGQVKGRAIQNRDDVGWRGALGLMSLSRIARAAAAIG